MNGHTWLRMSKEQQLNYVHELQARIDDLEKMDEIANRECWKLEQQLAEGKKHHDIVVAHLINLQESIDAIEPLTEYGFYAKVDREKLNRLYEVTEQLAEQSLAEHDARVREECAQIAKQARPNELVEDSQYRYGYEDAAEDIKQAIRNLNTEKADG